MTKLHRGLIANVVEIALVNCSPAQESPPGRHAHYLKHIARMSSRRRRKSSRIAESFSSRRRRAWSSEISDFSRAREARVANRIPENVRTIRRRWKSEEKSKGRARPRVSGGEERYRESQTRGGGRGAGQGGGRRARATCERSKAREEGRRGGTLGRKGDVNGEG